MFPWLSVGAGQSAAAITSIVPAGTSMWPAPVIDSVYVELSITVMRPTAPGVSDPTVFHAATAADNVEKI